MIKQGEDRLEQDLWHYEWASDPMGATYGIALVIGLGLLVSLVIDFGLFVFPIVGTLPILNRLLAPGGVTAEVAQKKASFAKMTKFINNGVAMDSLGPNHVMHNYLHNNRTEEVGGFGWTWSRMFNRSLFIEEGVWFHTLLLSIGFTQFLVVRCFITVRSITARVLPRFLRA